MESLIKRIEDLKKRFLAAKKLLDVQNKKKKEEAFRKEMSQEGFWNDQQRAIAISQEAEELATEVNSWTEMEKDITEAIDLLRLASGEDVSDLEEDLETKIAELETKFSKLEFLALFSEDYDRSNVILAIHAGTGGVDAQDWTEMLERMYLRFSEKKKWQVEILDRNYGNEAGIKNMVMRIRGVWAYGHLKSENGVHRLLRISPFDGDGLRHTSFALVEVMPEIEDDNVIVINDGDVRIDVFRASGPGGQSVNTTDSAVRVTHIPSGIVVSCQNERSQHQNKENALKILKTKLYKQALEKKETEERKLKGEVKKAEWGQQIRSYFMYGNRLIKDHRSNYETSNIDSVLDGEIDDFIIAYLRYLQSV